ncbi:MAG: RNA methyltransferase, partial [Oscillospiraceae bacterium]
AEKISDFKSPQGFFALCEKPKNFESIDKYEDTDIILNIKDKKQRIIALDNIQDPGNLGTIIRTALAFGFDCAFLSSNCVDLFSSKVIRATMGAFFGYNIICCENLTEDLNHLKNSGFTIYGTLLDNEAKNLKEIVFSKKSVIIIGNEGHGISENIKNICDEKIYIPMKPFKGQIQSLNAASAASVVMWEASK